MKNCKQKVFICNQPYLNKSGEYTCMGSADGHPVNNVRLNMQYSRTVVINVLINGRKLKPDRLVEPTGGQWRDCTLPCGRCRSEG